MVMLKLGFKLIFESSYVSIYLGDAFYGCDFILDGLMVLDTNYYDNNSIDFFSLIASRSGDAYTNSIK